MEVYYCVKYNRPLICCTMLKNSFQIVPTSAFSCLYRELAQCIAFFDTSVTLIMKKGDTNESKL